ncbi:MAG TPA: hypothetical protein VMF61_04260 [Candidatus Acidoferrales bacterium]|nr:hypothetical protein [Candidatus Acidoferrales bacterium]
MRFRRGGALWAAAGVALASCGGPLSNGYSPSLQFPQAKGVRHAACYATPQQPKTVTATITFYGWPDNTPPGNKIAHPVVHRVASGDGTWCNPTTFATEPSNGAQFPYGVKIYVPFLRQYFVREDDCTPSGPKSGSGSNGCYKIWFDLWIGGNAKSDFKSVVACERSLTPNAKVQVVVNPAANLPVNLPGPLYRDAPPPYGTCYGKPGRPI